MGFRDVARKFISYYKPFTFLFFFDLVCASVVAAVDLAFPQILNFFVRDFFVNAQDAIMDVLPWVLLGLLALYALRSACQYFISAWGHIMGARMEARMRMDLFEQYQRLSFSYYDRNNTGEMMSKLVTDLFDVSELAHHGPENLFIATVKIIGSFALLMAINVPLTLVMLAVTLLMAAYSGIQNYRKRVIWRAGRVRMAGINTRLQDSLGGIRVVKGFGNEAIEIEKFNRANDEFIRTKEQSYRFMGQFQTASSLFTGALYTTTIVGGGFFVAHGMLEPAQLIMYALYIGIFIAPVELLINFTETFQKGYAGFRRFVETLAEQPGVEDRPGARDLSEVLAERGVGAAPGSEALGAAGAGPAAGAAGAAAGGAAGAGPAAVEGGAAGGAARAAAAGGAASGAARAAAGGVVTEDAAGAGGAAYASVDAVASDVGAAGAATIDEAAIAEAIPGVDPSAGAGSDAAGGVDSEADKTAAPKNFAPAHSRGENGPTTSSIGVTAPKNFAPAPFSAEKRCRSESFCQNEAPNGQISSAKGSGEVQDRTFLPRGSFSGPSMSSHAPSVTYCDVHFSYEPGKEVLRGLSLEVPAGRTVALVGPSGGGKTTTCSLLPRFYDVDSGSVRIEGVDVRDVTIASLRDQVGIVQQDVYLFEGTIRDNIQYGDPNATQDRIEWAARQANIHDFVAQLPQGYDTFVGERGTRLSGGQKQRIAIARVFLRNPHILILDEATSALDNESEERVQESLEQLSAGRTTIVIAHRLSTIRNADVIAVVDDGRVVEVGTHEELRAAGGIYDRYYRMQFAGRDERAR